MGVKHLDVDRGIRLAGCGQTEETASEEGPPTVEMAYPQPIPLVTVTAPMDHGKWSTPIMRIWAPGDAARCRYCPLGTCSAVMNACLLHAPGFVSDSDAPSYSPAALAVAGIRRPDAGRVLSLLDDPAGDRLGVVGSSG